MPYRQYCREGRSMAGVQSARQKASLKSFQGRPAKKNSVVTNVITILEWTNSNPDTIIYELQNSLCGAVVAQPGRALDLFWGEAEDRAVVSSNLTDGTLCFNCVPDHLGYVIDYPSGRRKMVLGFKYRCQFTL